MLPMRPPSFAVHKLAAGASVLLWALAAGSLLLWWLHLPQDAEPPPVMTSLGQNTSAASAGAAMRALGHPTSAPTAPHAQKRYQLIGVVARSTGQGSALIAVDGQAPKAFLIGQEITEEWRLESVSKSGATLRGRLAERIVIDIAGAQRD